MSLAVPYSAASDALFERLRLVLSEQALGMYGEGVKVPEVSRFMGSKRPPFYVWMNPLARSTSSRGGATAHEFQTEFSFFVYMFATHAKPEEALMNVNCWVNSVFAGVSADATLGRAVDCAIPRMSDSGYDTTPEKKYVVAAEMEVTCKVFAVCPQEFKELVRNANRS